ncbi:MAG: NUDIX domain-containing protein [Anaerolineae bacterium]|nr:NUDIX domain-containing protein [Anaerolineae bacterium]
MLEATLCFLIDNQTPVRILLGHKKVGFGRGKYGGVGGKIEPGETPAAAAAREVWEETSLRVQEAGLHYAAHLTFLFPHRTEWSQVVHVFVTHRWQGEARESREIVPAWFAVAEIPYDQMWDDCRYWLPHILDGKQLRARFEFSADNDTVNQVEIVNDPFGKIC